MVRNGQKQTVRDRNKQKRTGMDRSRQERTDSDRNGKKWTEMDRIGQGGRVGAELELMFFSLILKIWELGFVGKITT